MPAKKWSLSRFVGPRAFDGRLTINWQHPLARGLVVCLVHNTGGGPGNTTSVTAVPNLDLVRGHMVNTPIVNRGANHRGLGTLLSTGNITEYVEVQAHSQLLWSSTDSFAVVSLAAFSGNTFPRIWDCDTYSGNRPLVSFRINSNVLEWYYGHTSTGLLGVIGATSLSSSLEPTMWIGSKDVALSSNHSKSFINGKLEGQANDTLAAWGPLTNTFMTTRSAGGSNGVESWKGLRHLDYFYKGRAISAEDARWLQVEPYAMLQAQPRRSYFSSTPIVTPITESLTDSLSFSDSLGLSVGIVKQLTDSLSFSDQLGFTAGVLEALADSLSFSDAIGLTNSGALSFTDTLGFTDHLDILSNGLVKLSDSLVFSDYYASNMIALSDSLQFNDSISILNIVSFLFNESLTFSDQLNYRVIIPLLFSDSLSFSDFLQTTSAHISVELNDFLFFLDSIKLFKPINPGLADQLTFSDNAKVVLGINIGLNDHLTFSDSLIVHGNTLEIRIGLNDSLSFSDSIETRLSTGDDNYLRRYLNDSNVVEPTETLDPSASDPNNEENRNYLRQYLNDKIPD